MNLKINIKARLQRHARNASFFKKKSNFFNIIKKFKFISLIIVLILPIYPSFWAMGVDKEFAVWNYDESTILVSFEWDGENSNQSNIFSQESWFVKPSSVINSSRDTTWIKNLIYYTIQPGDTLSTIADDFKVSLNSILWSNSLWSNRVLKVGDTLRIPPVSWIAYNVEANDTLDVIASKYKVDKLAILSQNQLDASDELKIGQLLILPGATKPEPPKPVIIEKKQEKYASKLTNKRTASVSSVNKTKLASWYSVAYRWSSNNKFAYGNCTYYVANHKNVTWRWNANQWLNNARAVWVPTWTQPVAGAIISFKWSWYNPYYGHVWLVSEVGDDYIIVKDMNYRRFNEVTVRKIPKYDSSIKWYIYAN